MATTATNMPTDIAKAHDLLGNQLYFLYTKWNYFKTLFCTTDEAIALLHYAAEFTFEIYRELLRDDIILSVCRITDRATTNVKGHLKDNLTLKYLATLIPNADTTLQTAVAAEITKIDAKVISFRQHRNRRIGHHDLDTRKKRSTALLAELGLTETDDVLANIAGLLNCIEQFYDHNEQSYDEGIYGSGNADDLLEFIKYEQSLQKYYEENEFGS